MHEPFGWRPTTLLVTIRRYWCRFGNRLTALRKERGLTQQAPADASGAHVTQIRRYEAGTSQPTLDVLRNLTLALNASADSLLFDPDERGPASPSLRLRLEALDQLDPDEHAAVLAMIEGALLCHQVRQIGVTHPTAS